MDNLDVLNFRRVFRPMLNDANVRSHLVDYVANHADYVANHEAALELTVMLLSADNGPLVGLGLPQNLLREQLRSYLDSEFFSSLISLLAAVSPVDRSLYSLYSTYQVAHPNYFINRERIINYLSRIEFNNDNSINIPTSFSNIYNLNGHLLFYLVLRGFLLEDDVDYNNLFAQFNRFSEYLHNRELVDYALMYTLNPDPYPQRILDQHLEPLGHSLFFDLALVNLEDIEGMQNVRLADRLFSNASPRVLREFLEPVRDF
ncbi:MAG: hypothetical protein ACEY3K_03905 [Wolbachia sp.]